jgi:hypothetical protein
MAPELTAEPDNSYEARENGALPNVTKQTDVFAFAMVALEVSNVRYAVTRSDPTSFLVISLALIY